jgi:Fe2+ transport system protein FeoA
VREPGLVGLIKWVAAGITRRRPDAKAFEHTCPGPTNLASLKAGESCIVEKFLDIAQVRKFLSLGVLPGTHLIVLKKEPVVVLRMGYSEFAFDKQLASTVQVHKL